MKPSCANCAFFEPISPSFGKCRRRSPQVTVVVSSTEHHAISGDVQYEVDSSISAEWPECNAMEWCGEFVEKKEAP